MGDRFFFFFFLCILGAQGQSTSDEDSVGAHNLFRARAGLPLVKWDSSIAVFTRSWVNSLRYDALGGASQKNPGMLFYFQGTRLCASGQPLGREARKRFLFGRNRFKKKTFYIPDFSTLTSPGVGENLYGRKQGSWWTWNEVVDSWWNETSNYFYGPIGDRCTQAGTTASTAQFTQVSFAENPSQSFRFQPILSSRNRPLGLTHDQSAVPTLPAMTGR